MKNCNKDQILFKNNLTRLELVKNQLSNTNDSNKENTKETSLQNTSKLIFNLNKI